MATMEHHQTQSQRLQTFERLRRLERSTRPEQILPLFSFEDHEEAVKRFEEEDKQRQQRQQRQQQQQQRQKRAKEEELRRIKVNTEARVNAKKIKKSDPKSKATNTRFENDPHGYISEDADDENDKTEYILAQPYTPDRPIGRRKVNSGSGLGSGLGPDITLDTRNTKKTPSTVERTPYTESDDAGSSDTSYATAATTPEDSEGQEQVQKHARTGSNSLGNIFETPTKQDRKVTAKPRSDNTVCKPSKQASTQVYVPQSRPKRGEFATIRAIDEPIEDWYFLVRECLQCEIAGVECGKQIPACTQCQRRFDVNVRGYRALNSSGSNGSGKYGFGEWSRPDGICSAGGRDAGSQCLVQRRWHNWELVKVLGLPDKREAALIRLESDSDDVWEGKLREAARLLDVYRSRRERCNWALPSQIGRIAGYSAPEAVAENDRLYKKKLEAALNSFQPGYDSNNNSNLWDSTPGGQKVINRKVRDCNETLKKVHINNDHGDTGSGCGSDVQPWWEEHLTYNEQKKKRRERWIEKVRQRRLRRSWRRRGDGPGAASDSDSDASVDSFAEMRSVHLGVNIF